MWIAFSMGEFVGSLMFMMKWSLLLSFRSPHGTTNV